MSIGWAWAFDTLFSWTKQIVSHFGGTRQGMAISWPKVITDKGGIRYQFQDQGAQRFTLGLVPHRGSWPDANLTRQAIELNQRPRGIP